MIRDPFEHRFGVELRETLELPFCSSKTSALSCPTRNLQAGHEVGVGNMEARDFNNQTWFTHIMMSRASAVSDLYRGEAAGGASTGSAIPSLATFNGGKRR